MSVSPHPAVTAESSVSAGWVAALDATDADLQRRAVAARTRRAYSIDTAEFARWATAGHVEPAAVDVRALRRYLAGLSEQGRAPSTVARKLAALRGLFRVQIELGERLENPAELLSSPKRPQRLPRVLKSSEIAQLLDRIPATTPLELRDRAMFELAYGSGLRAEELITLDVDAIDFDGEAVRVEGKGGRTRLVPAGEHALRRPGALSPARPPDPHRGRRPGAVSVQVRAAAEHLGRQAAATHVGTAGPGARSGARRGPSSCPAPLVRHPSSGGRGRPALDPGTARPRQHLHDPGLHSGRVGAAAFSL